MKFIKTIFGNIGSRVWLIVTASVIVLFLVVNIVAVAGYSTVFDSVFGGSRPILADKDPDAVAYIPDFKTKTEAREAGNALNIKINEEGIVLLKNADNALPFASTVKNISVFGKNSVDLVYGGTGSGGGYTDGRKTLSESLTAAGYNINKTLEEFYDDDKASGKGRTMTSAIENRPELYETGETPQSSYTKNVKDSYAGYKDAALVVISRIAGEGSDMPRTMDGASGAREPDDHALQLDKNETDLLASVCAEGFGHVIVIVNSPNAMELGFLDDPGHYAYHPEIDGCLWIGGPGNSGIMALGSVLNGTVTPSGHTVDTYARDFSKDPTWQNFGNNGVKNGNRYDLSGVTSDFKNYAYVDYEEGIYVGYRYYETRGHVEGDKPFTGSLKGTTTTDWNDWYDAHVVYPFGYGLSYTTFERSFADKTALDGKPITAESKIEVNVNVTNSGKTYAGKDALQLYVTPQYNAGGIEKAHKVLVDYAKTDKLEPGVSDEVTFAFDAYDLASYDTGKVKTDGGYVLEKGKYVFSLSTDAHTALDTFEMNVAADIFFDSDPSTGKAVSNRFEDADDELGGVMSRADFAGTFPSPRTAAEKKLSQTTASALNDISHNNPEQYTELPEQSVIDAENRMVLKDMLGADYDDERWETLLSQMDVQEMLDLVNKGAFQTIQIESVDKPKTLESDGPVGFVNFMNKVDFFGTCSYACGAVIASTWNKQIAFDFGKSVGNEGLIGNKEEGGMPYSGWYAPGVNIHRSPFCGRNYEYYSEDPLLTGIVASEVSKGAKSKGVYTYIKHFALNEQETDRSTGGLVTWADEQSIREIYLKQFEIAVKRGVKDKSVTGIMSSFNRIGTRWTGGDYRLLNDVLRTEWGFRGVVISDFASGSYMNPKKMFYGGGDLNLANETQYMWKLDPSSSSFVADVNILRKCAKNILYTTVNSNVYNVDVIGYALPVWTIVLIVVDCAVFAGLAVWGFFAVRGALKKAKKLNSQTAQA